jgi:thiamine pyrophosphokinase
VQPQRSHQPNGRQAVVVIGGDPLHPGAVRRLDPTAIVIAADSGYDHAVAAGLRPDVLIGDLDSITVAGLAAARADGLTIDAHPADKEATDTELAADLALAQIGDRGSLTIMGGGGDRLDHLLASITVLAQPRFARCAALAAWVGPAHVHVLHAPRTVDLGDHAADLTVSLIPLGDVAGVTTTGMRWPLRAEPLPNGTSRGISNLTSGGPATIAAATGVLAIVIPHAAHELVPPDTAQERP